MGFHVPERVIRLLCGRAAFDQGIAYYHAHKVDLIYAEHNEEHEYSKYRAWVQGLESHEVALTIDSDGDVNGECTCPAYYRGGPFCRHIAAALVAVLYLGPEAGADRIKDADGEDSGAFTGETGALAPRNTAASGEEQAGSRGDRQLVSSMLGMFTGVRQPPAEPAPIWICGLRSR